MPNEFRTSVGGQALMEGIMMRGPEKICCAVRKPDGTIDLTYDKVVTRWYNKVPLLRGICNMAENLYKGYKYLMHAADVAMEGVEDAECRDERVERRPALWASGDFGTEAGSVRSRLRSWKAPEPRRMPPRLPPPR